MRIKYLFLTLCLALALLAGGCETLETATVVEVIDGDTIIIDTGQTVRYIGIDAPEIFPEPAPYGIAAWILNRELVEGKEVILEPDTSDTDQYGRLLRYVYVGDMMVNGEMVRRGMALARSYPPDLLNQRFFQGLEAVARQAHRGMWE